MLKTSSYISDDTRPVFVTGGDGTVIAQNKPARRMLGPGTGKYCWDVVGKLDGAKRAPCRRGCALELLASGLGHSHDAQFKLHGNLHHISCTPTKGVVVCMLGPMASESNESGKFLQSLSPRERQVLLLLADGETTSSAADYLGVGESTVRTHVERMRSKLCVNTRAAVVAEGFRLGYLD
jgi:DNA-binding CsgD family transcriptional regulator